MFGTAVLALLLVLIILILLDTAAAAAKRGRLPEDTPEAIAARATLDGHGNLDDHEHGA